MSGAVDGERLSVTLFPQRLKQITFTDVILIMLAFCQCLEVLRRRFGRALPREHCERESVPILAIVFLVAHIFLLLGVVECWTSALARLEVKLQEYQCVVEYVPGCVNLHADCMSWFPITSEEKWTGEVECDMAFTLHDVNGWNVNDNVVKPICEVIWKEAVHSDNILQDIQTYLKVSCPEEGELAGEVASFFR
ncbi:hypothetical protein NDU88_005656 [Pleurodeles waltl]|uniref:Uncharacterized protein n=1 Tax=Pleurodeles waltl TaxID=8319 RepID=A0AAV7UIM9_PLEWA|nr:hypothetical protein NDU88_005656 [Pleurodeles waltl]